MRPGWGGGLLVLAELERRELITGQTASAFEGHHQYRFNHVLVRDVAYELLPRTERRERHREAALFFEDVGSVSGEVGAALAHHWRDAGDSGTAVDYLVAAAENAEHGWAKERAAALYREALEIVPGGRTRPAPAADAEHRARGDCDLPRRRRAPTGPRRLSACPRAGNPPA